MALQFPNQQNYLMQMLTAMPPQFQETEADRAKKKAAVLAGLENKMYEKATSQGFEPYPSQDDWYMAYKKKAMEHGVTDAKPSDILTMYDNYLNRYNTSKYKELNSIVFQTRDMSQRARNNNLRNIGIDNWFSTLAPEQQQQIMMTTGYDPYSKPSTGLIGKKVAIPAGLGLYFGGKYLYNRYAGESKNTKLLSGKAYSTLTKEYKTALDRYNKIKNIDPGFAKKTLLPELEKKKRLMVQASKPSSIKVGTNAKIGKVSKALKGREAAYFAPMVGETIGRMALGDYGAPIGSATGAGYLGYKAGKPVATSFLKFLAKRFPKIMAKAGATMLADSPVPGPMDFLGLGIAGVDIYKAYKDWQELNG